MHKTPGSMRLPGVFHAKNSVLTARFDEFERKFMGYSGQITGGQ